jgi:hypothetical protein
MPFHFWRLRRTAGTRFGFGAFGGMKVSSLLSCLAPPSVSCLASPILKKSRYGPIYREADRVCRGVEGTEATVTFLPETIETQQVADRLLRAEKTGERKVMSNEPNPPGESNKPAGSMPHTYSREVHFRLDGRRNLLSQNQWPARLPSSAAASPARWMPTSNELSRF